MLNVCHLFQILFNGRSSLVSAVICFPQTIMFSMSRLAGYSKVGETFPSAMFGNFELRVMGNVVFFPKDFVQGNRDFSLGFLLLENP